MKALIGILMDAFFIGLLIRCSYTDIRKRIISNAALALLMCLGITHTALIALTDSAWLTYPAGMVFAVPFFISWQRDGMGAGDVKLVMAITFYLGLLNAVIAFALMIPVLIALMIRSWIRNKTIKCRMPFAPVLTFSAIGAVLTGYLYALISM